MRRALFNLHLWAGLTLGLLIVLLGLSGSALVFRADIERWQTREWRTVEPLGSRTTVDRWVELATAAVPGKVLTRVLPPQYPEDAAIVVVQKRGARNLKDAELVWVFVDPYRDRVLGLRDANSNWVGKLQDFHYALFAGEPGLKVNGVAAIALTLLAVTGPFLWWPGWRRRREALRVRARPAAARWRDLHALSGVAAVLVLALIAVTGIYYAYRSVGTAVITLASGNAALVPPRVAAPAADASPASLERLLAAARAAEPAARLDELRPGRPPAGPASVSFRLEGDHVFGRHRMFLDPWTAAVLRIDRFGELPPGARLAGNMAPWHFGNFGGRTSQWIWFVAGFVPAFLFGSGLWLWWRRRRRAPAVDAAPPPVSPQAAGA